MSQRGKVVVPEDAPKPGDIYKHYKGDFYKVLFLSLHNDPDGLCVVYTGLYELSDFPFFSRMLESWNSEMELEGKIIKRFEKVGNRNEIQN